MSISYRAVVNAGPHSRTHCLVTARLPIDDLSPETTEWSLQDEDGHAVPSQADRVGDAWEITWVLSDLEAHASRVYTVTATSDSRPPCALDSALSSTRAGVHLDRSKDRVLVSVQGTHVADYVFDPSVAKPYLGPVRDVHGRSFTRLDFATKEHPHHRSLWVAIGDVNGVDFWNEPAGHYGKQLHQGLSVCESGVVQGRLTAENVWTTFDERPLLGERRAMTFYAGTDSNRLMDLDILLTAEFEDVVFGVTKEAGPLGIRVADSMAVHRGGRMMNAYGAVGEEECWGRPAPWCDYAGTVDSVTLGIAVFDASANELHPTCWHIRNYGLMAPNNFYFRGERRLSRGESMRFRYRVLFHEGDTAHADVAAHYHNYANPPAVSVERRTDS